MVGTRIGGTISLALALLLAFGARAEVQQLAMTVIGPEVDEFAPGGHPPQPTMFGYAVATRGSVAFVGMPMQGNGNGRVAIFTRNDKGEWLRSGTLLAPPKETGFGGNLAYARGVVAVTAASGLYLYRFVDNKWAFEKKLDAPAGAAFGSVAYNGKTLAVTVSPAGKAGFIYIYEGDHFEGPTMLAPQDVAPQDAFGYELALGARTLAAGAPLQQNSRGAVYLFVQSSERWEPSQKLLAPAEGGELYFGASVAIGGKRIVVGAPGVANPNTPIGHRFANQGAAYVFSQQGQGWSLQQTLQPTDEPGEYLSFGTQVRLRGERIAVTSPINSRPFDPATCLIYTLAGEQWIPQWYSFAEYSTGFSLSLSGGAVILGGPIDSGGGYDIGHGVIADLPQNPP